MPAGPDKIKIRRQAEKEIMSDKENSEYWKTIIDTMADGLMIVDSKGIILSINDAMANLIGYLKEELIGESCKILDCDTCSRERAGGQGQYCVLFRDGKIRRSRCSLKRKDGSYIYVMKNASVLKDSDGAVIGGVETISDLSEVVKKENVILSLRKELSNRDGFHNIIGISPVMQQIFSLISSAAQSDAPVIIYGESGTGKELIAQAIHDTGPRKSGPFVKVNCAALNESLLESELFGHVKGAFTGAEKKRIGRFEAAHKGDIFLDEIGEIPLTTQVKLLRVLQEKEFERVGDNKTISIDVRVISATHKDLKTMSSNGEFREDLYYRIGVIPIYLPPLRERKEDIPLLINTFINKIRLKTGKPVTGMNDEALGLMNSYLWPGNIRELINAIEYAFVICSEGLITPDHLPSHITEQSKPFSPVREKKMPEKHKNEKQQLIEALDKSGGNKSKAAKILGISRVSLYKRLKKYDILIDKKVRKTPTS